MAKPNYAIDAPDYAVDAPDYVEPPAVDHKKNARMMQRSLDADQEEQARIAGLGNTEWAPAALGHFLQDSAFGGGDELAGLRAGITAKLGGQDFGPAYDQAQSDRLQLLRSQEEESPHASGIGGAMSVLTPGGLILKSAKGAGILARLARAAVPGMLFGGASGALGSNDLEHANTTSAGDRAVGTGVGSVIGGLTGMGLSAPGIVKGIRAQEIANPLTRFKDAAQALAPTWYQKGGKALEALTGERTPTQGFQGGRVASELGQGFPAGSAGEGFHPSVGEVGIPPEQPLLNLRELQAEQHPAMQENTPHDREGLGVPEQEPVMRVEDHARPGRDVMAEPVMQSNDQSLAPMSGHTPEGPLSLDDLHTDWVNQQTMVDAPALKPSPLSRQYPTPQPSALFEGVPQPPPGPRGWEVPREPNRFDAPPEPQPRTGGDARTGFEGAGEFDHPSQYPPAPPPPQVSMPQPAPFKASIPEPDFDVPADQTPRLSHPAGKPASAVERPMPKTSQEEVSKVGFKKGRPKRTESEPLSLDNLKEDPALKELSGAPEVKKVAPNEGKAKVVDVGGMSPRDLSAYVADAKSPSEAVGMLDELGVTNKETLRKAAGLKSTAEVEQILKSIRDQAER